MRVSHWWWEQDSIDLEGAKKRAAEATTDSDLDSGGEDSSGSSGSSGAEWSGAEK